MIQCGLYIFFCVEMALFILELQIIYIEKLLTQSAALKREAEIKSWNREKKIRILKIAF